MSSSTRTTVWGRSASAARISRTSWAPNPAAGTTCRRALSAGTASPIVRAPSTSDQNAGTSLSVSSTASHATLDGATPDGAAPWWYQDASVSVFPQPGPALSTVTGRAVPSVS